MTSKANWNRCCLLLFYCFICIFPYTSFSYDYDLSDDDYPLVELPPSQSHPVKRFYFADDNKVVKMNIEVQQIGTEQHDNQIAQAPIKQMSRKDRLLIEKSISEECGMTTSPYIAGGRDALPGEFPSFVSLSSYNTTEDEKLYCAGTILSRRYILTAGHCILPNTKVAFVRAGIYNPVNTIQGANTRMYTQEKICRSRHFSTFDLSKDIAIIKLSKPMHFDSMVQSACLPKHRVKKNIQANVIGMGFTHASELGAIRARKLQVLPVKQTMCKSHYPQDYHICFQSNKADQVGDSCIGMYR